MNRATLGSALRELRRPSGLEAEAVARSAAMSGSKLSKIENGNTAPSVTDVDCIRRPPGQAPRAAIRRWPTGTGRPWPSSPPPAYPRSRRPIGSSSRHP
ncbi:helix-turn-helix domain-containing protein [Streptomyces yaizuensis]|uniref:helix-turn-helix domain-containing protein n=1 Tax=Streptomyces yaizuensis TaxID=2989713 RepID=UPI00389AFCD3